MVNISIFQLFKPTQSEIPYANPRRWSPHPLICYFSILIPKSQRPCLLCSLETILYTLTWKEMFLPPCLNWSYQHDYVCYLVPILNQELHQGMVIEHQSPALSICWMTGKCLWRGEAVLFLLHVNICLMECYVVLAKRCISKIIRWTIYSHVHISTYFCECHWIMPLLCGHLCSRIFIGDMG